ncbi:MAG TPA: TetR/AcrR family transcriptional regulator [Sediminibacterium sp.]|nr:TetR/AcrR family transcriptional regulator [Sediminibacterium sp.]
MTHTKDDKIRGEILQEAQKLFQQYGVRKTTMEDIARSMGKGKSTLYYYFCSKDEIFDAVIRKEMSEVFEQVKEAVAAAETAEAKLKAFFITKIKGVQKRVNLSSVVREGITDRIHCVKHLYQEYDKRERKLLKEILQFGLAEGSFSKDIRNEMEILPSVMVSSLKGLEWDVLTDSHYPKLGPRLESIISILVRGLQRDEKIKTKIHG